MENGAMSGTLILVLTGVGALVLLVVVGALVWFLRSNRQKPDYNLGPQSDSLASALESRSAEHAKAR